MNVEAFVSSDGELLWPSAEMPSLGRLTRKRSVPYKPSFSLGYGFGVAFVSEPRLKPVHGDEKGDLAQHVNSIASPAPTGLPNRRRLDATFADLEVKARIGFDKTD